MLLSQYSHIGLEGGPEGRPVYTEVMRRQGQDPAMSAMVPEVAPTEAGFASVAP